MTSESTYVVEKRSNSRGTYEVAGVYFLEPLESTIQPGGFGEIRVDGQAGGVVSLLREQFRDRPDVVGKDFRLVTHPVIFRIRAGRHRGDGRYRPLGRCDTVRKRLPSGSEAIRCRFGVVFRPYPSRVVRSWRMLSNVIQIMFGRADSLVPMSSNSASTPYTCFTEVFLSL